MQHDMELNTEEAAQTRVVWGRLTREGGLRGGVKGFVGMCHFFSCCVCLFVLFVLLWVARWTGTEASTIHHVKDLTLTSISPPLHNEPRTAYVIDENLKSEKNTSG